MNLSLNYGLPFVKVELEYRANRVEVDRVLLDTGSATTLLSVDAVASLGIAPEPSDPIRRLRGVGGVEYVFSRRIDRLSVGDHGLAHFEVELGALDYGFDIQGILGMDFLLQAGAIVDLQKRCVTFGTQAGS